MFFLQNSLAIGVVLLAGFMIGLLVMVLLEGGL